MDGFRIRSLPNKPVSREVQSGQQNFLVCIVP